jgi:hypothetical protein
LHGLKLADLVSFFSETQTITKIPPDNWYIHGIVAGLVIDFLKDHEHHGASELLKMVKKQTLNLPELQGLKLTDLFSYFFGKNTEENVSECKKIKVAADLHGLKTKDLDQYMSSVKVVFDTEIYFLDTDIFRHFWVSVLILLDIAQKL